MAIVKVGSAYQKTSDISTVWEPQRKYMRKLDRTTWVVFVEAYRGERVLKLYQTFEDEASAWFFYDDVILKWKADDDSIPATLGSSV